MPMRIVIYCLTLCLLPCSAYSTTAARSRPAFTTRDFSLVLTPREPSQITAFYSARGFPPAALAKIGQACFLSLSLHNNSNTIVWFDLGNWRFNSAKQPLHQILRRDWYTRWRTLGLAQRLQSIFRRTLAPRRLNIPPHDSMKGYITLPRTDQPMTIRGDIYVGKQKNRLYTLRFVDMRCGGNQAVRRLTYK